MDNWKINDLINSQNLDAHGYAHVEIKERIMKTGVNKKQADAAMYYAYEHGHSAGEDEVLRIALNLCSEVFEAANF
jgi:hypothetical protein